MTRPLTFIIIGATGDLAQRKIFPALFAAFARGHLPSDVRMVGVARTPLDNAAFRERLAPNLKCEELTGQACSLQAGVFLKQCHYHRCDYASHSDFQNCLSWLSALELGIPANRILYLAIPPFLFSDTLQAMSQGGLLPKSVSDPWTRVVVEKPFGHDRTSYDLLQRDVQKFCQEEQIYRIDHYLGKEVVQNLLVLRFANTVFESLWSRTHIQHVHIAWSEQLGVKGRTAYFDRYGILRDVMQNHLLQILALVAMERPLNINAENIHNAKADVLRHVQPLDLKDLLVGQYIRGGAGEPGYLEEAGVPVDSRTPTYAAAVLHLNTPRWQGVPFLMTAGKGLGASATEVRLHFRNVVEGCLQLPAHAGEPNNELIIRVQPDEQLKLRIVTKIPGIGMQLGTTELDLRFREKYAGLRIADAYENLLLDIVRGDHSLFMRNDELELAWDIFTPVLQNLEAQRIRPETYLFGGAAPHALDALATRHGISDARIFEESGSSAKD